MQVKVMGKPDPVIYIAAMELIGLEKDEVLAVGDSLEHDISGEPPPHPPTLSFPFLSLTCSHLSLQINKERLATMSSWATSSKDMKHPKTSPLREVQYTRL